MTSANAVSGVFDVAVVGAGILGLACARAAALRGLKVVVIDRDAQANGASVRNFGFVTVTGQERGAAWQRARRSCAIWQEIAAVADIPILQRGLWLTVRRPEAVPLLEAFLATEMGEGCELLTPSAAAARCSELVNRDVVAVLHSAAELRVESREAIPKLAAWLEAQHGVTFLRHTTVHAVEPPHIDTSRGRIAAGASIVCPGDDHTGLFAERIASYGLGRCKLQMLRLATPGFRLPGTLMSDLGLVRYSGYAALPEAAALRRRLETEQPEYLANGVHLVTVQSADGSLIVGDSHHYATTPDPFADEQVDRLILAEFALATGRTAPEVLSRWVGTYSSAADRTLLVDTPADGVRLAIVTSGSGASTGFAIGEEVVGELFGAGV
jgi:FAD dependent oxidoreductase TIGR03364